MDKLNDLFTRIINKLNKKVDSVEGKGLSTNDFTNEEQTKLSEIEDGAQVNTIETISLNGTNVEPDEAKNVEIKVTADNFEGVLPVKKGGTGLSYMTGENPLTMSSFRTAYGLPPREIIENIGVGRLDKESEFNAVHSCHLIMTAHDIGARFAVRYNEPRVDVMGGIYDNMYWHKQLAFSDQIPSIATTSAAGLVKPGTGLSVSADGTLTTTLFDLYPDGISHNGIFRGDNLGTTPTEEQWGAITSGTFKNLFIGDYWENDNVKYRIAGFDIFLNTGDVRLTRHHAVIVPDTNLYTAQMNTTNTTDGAYYNSAMKKENLASALATVQTAFGDDHIVKRKTLLANATSGANASGWKWYETQIDLMTEAQVYGVRAWGAPAHNGYDIGEKYSRFPLFDLAPEYITNRTWYWLQDVYSAPSFCSCDSGGHAGSGYASLSGGVRPYFCIGSNEADADMPVEGPEMMDEYMQYDEAVNPEFERPVDTTPETEDEPLTK